jgi:hypothetical protein
MVSGFGNLDEGLAAHEAPQDEKVSWGTVTKVDPELNEIQVQLGGTGSSGLSIKVKLNNHFTSFGSGLRVMPMANVTNVLVYQDTGNDWVHFGYMIEGIDSLMDNKEGTKQGSTSLLVNRYLEEGEVQLVGYTGNELLFAKNGDVLIQDSNGSYVLLDAQTATFETSAANVKFDLDKVRIRSGNARRPVKEDTYEDEYMYTVDGATKKESDLTDDERDSAVTITEFNLQVGTLPGDNGVDDPKLSPTVGELVMASTVVREDGTPVGVAGKKVQFLLKMASGAGIAIDKDGSLFLIDRAGGDGTRFENGPTAERSFRVGNNYIGVNADGVDIHHTSGASISLDASGDVSITHKNGRSLNLDAYGLLASFPGAEVKLMGKTVTMISPTVNFGMMPTDSLLAANLTSAFFDLHVHAGPVGPPVTLMTPLVLSGVLTVAGINVSI